jgi:hypothetical protein
VEPSQGSSEQEHDSDLEVMGNKKWQETFRAKLAGIFGLIVHNGPPYRFAPDKMSGLG